MATSIFSPKGGTKTLATAVETQSRLEKCWSVDINWSLYPRAIHLVSNYKYVQING